MKTNMIIGLLICAVMTATSLTAFAAEKEPMLIAPAPAADEMVEGVPQVTIDGEVVDLSKSNLSQYIFEVNGNVMVPLRTVAEKMGYTVEWNNEDKSITIGDNEWEVVLYIGSDSYYGVTKIEDAVGMTPPQSYGAAPQLVEDTTFVPAKMFELMGYSYNSAGQFVDFTKAADKDNVQIPNAQIPSPFIPYENIDAAKKALSFSPSVPSYIPTGYEIDEITAIEDYFLQIVYINSKDDSICYRVVKGNKDMGYITGDYNTYANENKITIDNYEVAVRGNENIAGAVWSNNDITYSILSSRELTEKEIEDIIKSL